MGGRRGYRSYRSLLAPERKFYDLYKANYQCGPGTTVTNGIIQFTPVCGVGPSGRLGERVKVVSMRHQLRYMTAPSSDNTYYVVPAKFYIILNRQTNGGDPSVADIFDVNAACADMPLMSLPGRRKFRVIKVLKFGYTDGTTMFQPNAVSTQGQVRIKGFTKRLRITVIFTNADPGSNAIGNVITNSFVFASSLGSAAVSGSGYPTANDNGRGLFSAVTRYRFIDP